MTITKQNNIRTTLTRTAPRLPPPPKKNSYNLNLAQVIQNVTGKC